MGNEVETFFDSLAPRWDEWANDDLTRVRILFEKAGLRKGDRVLDVACGTGVVTGLLRDYTGKPVKGIDISGEMIAIAKRKYAEVSDIVFEKADFLSHQGAYDFVMVYNAYPHFLDREGFLSSLKANLACGGRFAIVHSLGRERLSKHHEGLSQNISRDLLPVGEEAGFYAKDFRLSCVEEGDDFYIIAGELIAK